MDFILIFVQGGEKMTKRVTGVLVISFSLWALMWSHTIIAGNVMIFGDPELLPKFALLDHNTQPFTKTNFQNQWSLMFFGYTSCPDVCPTTLGVLDTASSMINSKPDKDKFPVKVIMVSLDPVRDTPKKLKEYIKYFNNDFVAVTGVNNGEVIRLTHPIGVEFDFEDSKTNLPIEDYEKLTKDDDYLVHHFGGIFVIDPMAQVTAIVFPPHDPEKLVSLFRYIRDTYAKDQKNSN